MLASGISPQQLPLNHSYTEITHTLYNWKSLSINGLVCTNCSVLFQGMFLLKLRNCRAATVNCLQDYLQKRKCHTLYELLIVLIMQSLQLSLPNKLFNQEKKIPFCILYCMPDAPGNKAETRRSQIHSAASTTKCWQQSNLKKPFSKPKCI